MVIKRGQQQNWAIQFVMCNVSLSNTIVHHSPSTSRMAHQEYPHTRASVGSRCHLRLGCSGSYISLYEGDTTNSLCMCAFSAIKGSLPISRPCLRHYLSVPQCFFPHFKFFVLLQKCLPTYSQTGRQWGRWQLQMSPVEQRLLFQPFGQSDAGTEFPQGWGSAQLRWQDLALPVCMSLIFK